MGGDGAESTASETAAVQADGKLDHVVCGNTLAAILGMRSVLEWQVVHGIEFFCCLRRIGRIDHDIVLHNSMRMNLVGFDFNKAEILGVSMGIAVQAVNKTREAGLISPRPAIGSVVCAKDRPLWKGQVLIVSPSGGTQHYMPLCHI